MGIVWLATDLELRRKVALKRSQTGDAGQIRREAMIGAGLTHPHVVTVLDVAVDGDDRWLVMEYVPSRSLAEVLANDGPLPPNQVRRIGVELAGALAVMHAKGMVHRDIKPSNVLIAQDGTAKLTDLGIARWAEATLTGGAYAGGTAAYLAPEAADDHEAGPASDIFSLGATLFAAVTGGSPWGGSGPAAQLRRAAAYDLEPMPPTGGLAPVLGALMAKQPARRPTADQVQGLLSGDTTDRVFTPGRPHRGRLVLVSAVVVGVMLVSAGVFAAIRHRTPAAPSKPAAATSPGALGDPRTADPCALLVPGSLARFGKVALEPNYGNFNHCDLTVDTTGKSDIIDVSLEFQLPEEYPAVPPVPGKLGQVQPVPPTENRCQRSIALPNLYLVVISARQVHNQPAPLCGAAEAVALGTYGLLANGPIPHRPAYKSPSTGALDACTLLSGKEISTAIGAAVSAEPDYGNWTCYWEHGGRQVTVSFGREYPLEGDPPDGTKTTVSGRLAYVDTSTNDGRRDECDLTLVHRRYTPTVASEKGTPPQREETVIVSLENKDTSNVQTECAAATVLASALVARLPH
ncbi:hypothetical protein GCM10009765_35580 [Fodinicola feengrottensis]|uniref:non-specific serine/threonine protein kinase n=2 Tax=Fodinicola feengrottensis TaxID=435914 RepID=A0ABN2H7J4_9ACTN